MLAFAFYVGQHALALGSVIVLAEPNRRPVYEMPEGARSPQFEGLDATERAGIEAALNRCRHLAAQIESGAP